MQIGDGDEGHLTAEGLQRIRRGEAGKEEARRLLRHLLAGCQECRALVRPGPWRTAASEELYELPIKRALRAFKEQRSDLEDARTMALARFVEISRNPAPARSRFPQPPDLPIGPHNRKAWCELLLEVVWLRHTESTEALIDLAELALHLAEEVPAGLYPAAELADLRGRAWTELANALRVADDLSGAETALAHAYRELEAGAGHFLVIARAFDVAASLYRVMRRLDEALQAGDTAAELYAQHGEPHLAGRVLVAKGIALRHTDEPEKAVEALGAALKLLDPAREPTLVLLAIHARLLALVDTGDAEAAARSLWRYRPLYRSLGTRLDHLRLLGVEGKIAEAQGQLGRAETLFSDEVAGLRQEGRGFDAALAALDLAAVLLTRGGRSGEVLDLVDEMFRTFGQLKIRREALATLVMFHRALVQGEASAQQASQVAEQLAEQLRRLAPG